MAESLGREEAAIAEVIEAIRQSQQGQSPPPYGLERKTGVRLVAERSG